jgi:signal transduction histidine kinase
MVHCRPLRLLLIEDHPADAELVLASLVRGGLKASSVVVSSYPEVEAALADEAGPPDVVLSDFSLPGMDLKEIIRRVRERCPGTPVIVVTGTLNESQGVHLIRLGATDLFLKDRLARLGPAIEVAVASRDLNDALRRAQARERHVALLLQGMLDHSPAAIGIYAPDGVSVTNQRYDALVRDGLDAHDLLRSFPDPVTAEITLGRRTYLVGAFALPSIDGQQARAVHLTDITQQKDVECNLRQARAALQAQSRELQQSNEALVTDDRLKNELVNTVSHELRTPLTSIIGYAELLRDNELLDGDPTAGKMIGMIERNGVLLLDLVANLLSLSSLDQGRTASPTTLIDLRRVVRNVVEVLLPVARSSGLHLTGEHDAGPLWVRGDAGSLERMLLNLGSNALKFTRAETTVVIRTVRSGQTARIDVVDEGIGIQPEDVPKLGSRFFRTETARTDQVPGTGLGLAVVRAIVDHHGGRFTVDSDLGVGTTMAVHLPLAPDPVSTLPHQQGHR